MPAQGPGTVMMGRKNPSISSKEKAGALQGGSATGALAGSLNQQLLAVGQGPTPPRTNNKKAPPRQRGSGDMGNQEDPGNEGIAEDKGFNLERSSPQATCCP